MAVGRPAGYHQRCRPELRITSKSHSAASRKVPNVAEHRIIGTRQESFDAPNGHPHVVIVGTAKLNGYSKLWTITQVYNAMDQGDTFYTHGEKSQKTAAVQKYKCPLCDENTLRSAPEAVTDNNLESLPTC
jgi:hypothetical protein